ncbi:MAG: CU044_5270 family protein [Actinomycetota bacterium]|nr:CU044_5270 family protein [Actinomycetota bacterium]
MDEFERIRDALGAPQTDDAAKARARQRLRRLIDEEGRPGTAALQAPVEGSASHPAHRRRYSVLLGIAAALAFISIVLQVVLPSGHGGPAASGASELRRLADLASTIQPIEPGAGFLYTDVKTQGIGGGGDVSSGLDWDLVVRERLQTWVASDGSGRQVKTIEQVDFASPDDRTRWIQAGRPPLPASAVEGYRRGGLSIFDVATLPSDPDELRNAIHAGRVIEEPSGPLGIFTGIGDLLAQPNTPPDVRHGLLELAAETPGITFEPAITDPLGRPGEGFTFHVQPSTETLIIDPDTARVLATIGVDDQGRSSWSAYVRDAAVPTMTTTP